ncbi:hypothetical protein ACEE90_05545 [Corynebacterium phoceense]|uniref:hypothetical protein n=1 Tax=Corynebacterium phoceense TaxID=1686286 RepID=UPI00211B920D|nr:hypothetical protein [Corynebacterium phoceense]MCQ9337577.1 hypothetical protein [Corynebacterium phoceense]
MRDAAWILRNTELLREAQQYEGFVRAVAEQHLLRQWETYSDAVRVLAQAQPSAATAAQVDETETDMVAALGPLAKEIGTVRSAMVDHEVSQLRSATNALQIQFGELPGILPTAGDLNADSGHAPGEERDR